MKKKYFAWIFWAYVLVVIIATTVPWSTHRKIGFGIFRFRLDYYLHLFTYFGFVFLYTFWRLDEFLKKKLTGIFLSLLLCLSFAFSTELLQLLFPYRSFSYKDFVVNVIGISSSFLVFLLIRPTIIKYNHKARKDGENGEYAFISFFLHNANMFRKKYMPLIFWAYIVLLTIMSVVPTFSTTERFNVFSLHIMLDYLLHVGAYFFLALLLILWKVDDLLKNNLAVFVKSLFLSLSFAFISEVIQLFVPGRVFNINDFAANTGGILMVFTTFTLFRNTIKKSKLGLALCS